MTTREREHATLEFGPVEDGLSIEETFFPWDITIENFRREGLTVKPYEENQVLSNDVRETFLGNSWATSIMRYERDLGFNPILRIGMYPPVLTGIREMLGKDYIQDKNDFKKLEQYSWTMESKYFSDADFQDVYGPYRAGHERGDFSVRVNISGFFFAPRELLGIENHLYAFYDSPNLLHEINEYLLNFYTTYLTKIFAILPADVLYLSEDLSGKNGPMISPSLCEEFVCYYYKKLFPVLRAGGAKYIFVDTDGDFMELIPAFMNAGVEGFLPMDVHAGMDIVRVRRDFPNLRFIGGYDKLAVAGGKQAIDGELARIAPVAEQGGYIIGCDHQLPPETSLENYRYYIKRLTEFSQRTIRNA